MCWTNIGSFVHRKSEGSKRLTVYRCRKARAGLTDKKDALIDPQRKKKQPIALL